MLVIPGAHVWLEGVLVKAGEWRGTVSASKGVVKGIQGGLSRGGEKTQDSG